MQIETAGTPAPTSAQADQQARLFPHRVPLILGIAGLAALILIPAAVVLYLGIATARQNTFQMLEGQSVQYLDSVVDRVSGNLKPVETQSGYAAGTIASGAVDPSDNAALRTFLRGALAGLPQVHDLVFIRPDLHILRVNRETGQIAERDWSDDDQTRQIVERATTNHDPYWGEFFYVESTGRTMLNYRAPVWRDGKLLGVLVSSVALDELANYVTAAAKGPVRNAFILTQKGQVLAHSGPDETLGGVSDQHPLKTLPQISDQILATLGSMGLTRWADTSDETMTRILAVQGEPYMVITRRIAGFGEQHWLAGLYFPMAIIDGQIGRINRMAITGSIILILSVCGALLLGRGITRPVLQFVDATRRMRRGASSPQRVEESVFRELDDAGSTLNAVLGAWHRIKSFLPTLLADRSHKSDETLGNASAEREITVMFTDIAGFTSLAADRSPTDVAALLNEHFNLISDAIDSEGGTIDKYIGDSVMAFWGAPHDQPNHAEFAFNAALEISSRIRKDNIRRREAGLEPIRVRIGVHSGKAIVGNIGAPGHLNYTAVGDTVNAAQRVEALGKSLGDDGQDVVILVSRETIEQIGMGFESFSAGVHSLPGRYGALEVFRLS